MCLAEEQEDMLQELDELRKSIKGLNERLLVIEERQDMQARRDGIDLGLNERLTRLEELFDKRVVKNKAGT